MINKIKQALKTKFSTLGLGEKAFDGVAEFLSKTVTEDANIETAVAGMEPMLKVFQTEADRRVTDLQKKNTELEEKLKITPPPTTPSVTNPVVGVDDVPEPAWAKAIREQQEAILNKQALTDKASKENALKASAKSLMIKQGIKESLCDKILNKHTISETDTIESISLAGVEEYNSIRAEFSEEAGMPSVSTPVVSEDVSKAYFEEKAAKHNANLKE